MYLPFTNGRTDATVLLTTHCQAIGALNDLIEGFSEIRKNLNIFRECSFSV